MWKEFKEFAMKGNITDLAVGIIIGGAFQKIVSSLVNDIVMPVISIFTGKMDFSALSVSVGDVSIKYGSFLTAVIDFLLMAFSIFLIIRYMNKLNRKIEDVTAEGIKKLEKKKLFKKFRKEKPQKPTPVPTIKVCPYCFKEINIKATRCPYCTSEQQLKMENQISIEQK